MLHPFLPLWLWFSLLIGAIFRRLSTATRGWPLALGWPGGPTRLAGISQCRQRTPGFCPGPQGIRVPVQGIHVHHEYTAETGTGARRSGRFVDAGADLVPAPASRQHGWRTASQLGSNMPAAVSDDAQHTK